MNAHKENYDICVKLARLLSNEGTPATVTLVIQGYQGQVSVKRADLLDLLELTQEHERANVREVMEKLLCSMESPQATSAYSNSKRSTTLRQESLSKSRETSTAPNTTTLAQG